ncbi:MAG: thioesterase [Acidimicrobiia bacterium]
MINRSSNASVTFVVDEASTAIALGSGDVPVLGTPKVLALAEEAAVKAIGNQLPKRLTTVGVDVQLGHYAPSAVGSTVVAKAVLEDIEDNELIFHFEVFEGDKVVADGHHVRSVIDRERFLSRLAAT